MYAEYAKLKVDSGAYHGRPRVDKRVEASVSAFWATTRIEVRIGGTVRVKTTRIVAQMER